MNTIKLFFIKLKTILDENSEKIFVGIFAITVALLFVVILELLGTFGTVLKVIFFFYCASWFGVYGNKKMAIASFLFAVLAIVNELMLR